MSLIGETRVLFVALEDTARRVRQALQELQA
jgi:hypothetical protein